MRIHSLRLLRGLGATDLIAYLYPRIFSLHTMSDEVNQIENALIMQEGYPDNAGQLVLPPVVRATRKALEESGAYLMGIFI
jgi:protein transport protein SEC24